MQIEIFTYIFNDLFKDAKQIIHLTFADDERRRKHAHVDQGPYNHPTVMARLINHRTYFLFIIKPQAILAQPRLDAPDKRRVTLEKTVNFS